MPRPTSRALVLTAAAAVLVAAPLALAAPKSAPLGFRRTVLADQGAYGEPSLAITRDGRHIAVCVPGGKGTTSVWYSSNDGRSFGTSHTDSTNGGGDCEIDFLPDGTLLNADLEISDSAIRYSKDFGKTWQGTQTAGVEQDRQWFAHSRDGKKAYLVYHDFAAEGEFYAQSNDGGLTWPAELAAQPVNSPDQVALPGLGAGRPGTPASLVDQGVNTFSGPMLISPDGREMYVLYSVSDAKANATTATSPAFGPPRGIVVAHKGPEATTFTNSYAVPSDGSSTLSAIFPWGTVDSAGNVYVLFNSDQGSPGHFHTYYVVSRDKTKTWSKPVKVDDVPLGRGAQVFVTGAAGAPGVLDLAWYGERGAGGADDLSNVWSVHFAQVRNATSAHPSITRAVIASTIHRGAIGLGGLIGQLEGGDRSLADFFELAIGPDGMAQIAYASNVGFGTGKPGTLGSLRGATGAPNGRVVWAKQTGGRSAWAR